MPRGGRRNGAPGAQYPNRSDIAQAVRTAPGQPYGQATAQAQAQQAIPLPGTPAPAAVPAPTSPPFTPPEPGLLSAPTARPNEPVTAGLTVGPGPGPEALAGGPPDGQILANLYQAFKVAPSAGLMDIIRQTERNRGPVQ